MCSLCDSPEVQKDDTGTASVGGTMNGAAKGNLSFQGKAFVG